MRSNVHGNLYTVAAPSGAGKTTLVNALVARDTNVVLSVSHTTRAPRPGEVNGQSYNFVDEDTFNRMRKAGQFLESAQVFGNQYGTSEEQVDGLLEQGKDVILEIDWQGAKQVRSARPETIGIFILPPSVSALESRLNARGQDSKEIIRGRMAQAQEEMSHYSEFDYLLINDNFEHALGQLGAVFTANRLTLDPSTQRNADLLQDLLANMDSSSASN